MVLEQHVWRSSLDLSINDLVPEPLSLYGFAATSRLFILAVELLKGFAVALVQTWALVRAHQCPLLIVLNSLHEQIRNPKRVEQVTRSVFFSAIVLPELKEIDDISMPRLQVNGEGALALAAALVHVARSVIVDLEHGHQAVRESIGASDVRVRRSNAMDGESDASRVFRNDCALFECVVNAID